MTVFTRASNRETTPTKDIMPDLNEFMTTQEAAKKLGFTIRAVNRLVATKRLEGIRLGRMYLISRTFVKTYLDKTNGMSKNDPRRKSLTK